MQAARGAPYGLRQVFVGHLLKHKPDRAGVKRLLGENGTLLHCQHDDLRSRDLRAQTPDRLDGVALGQAQIEHQDVGAVLAHVTSHRVEVSRFRDHLEILLAFQQQPEAATHQRMVIGEHHPDRRLDLPQNRPAGRLPPNARAGLIAPDGCLGLILRDV